MDYSAGLTLFSRAWYLSSMSVAQDYFFTSTGEKVQADRLIESIRAFVSEKTDAKYKIIIGTDSLALNAGATDFVTALVVQRVGNGGKYFWRRIAQEPVFNFRDRIIKEVVLSLGAATQILELLKELDFAFEFEVHVDVGPNGRTSALISEVTGMIRSYNFLFKTKPESYAASSVADKHV
jgi:predicted RNase H-related nuclease YkuK (DUF458 family)